MRKHHIAGHFKPGSNATTLASLFDTVLGNESKDRPHPKTAAIAALYTLNRLSTESFYRQIYERDRILAKLANIGRRLLVSSLTTRGPGHKEAGDKSFGRTPTFH